MPIFDVTVKLQDAYNRVSVKRYQVDSIGLPEANSAVASMCADLAGLTEAEILEYNVSQKTAYTDAVVAGANIDEGITLSVMLESNKKAVLKVPSPTNVVLNPDGTVDIADALVSDYVDNWITGTFKVSDGETVTTLLSGKLDR